MRALRLTGWKHDPELQDVPTPEAGPGEVLVRIGGAGACHSDLHLMRDFDAGMLPWSPPFTLGHENAGWVESLGAGVAGLEVGQPVAVYGPWGCGRCSRCVAGLENYCERQAEIGAYGGGLGLDGGMAPFMAVAARHLVPLDGLSPVAAAPLTDAALTPYHAIKRSLGLLVPGSTAVVIGAGGLGHMAVQILAALTPATIVAVDRDQDALALAQGLGAAHGVLTGTDAASEIRDITRGRGAELVLDVVGVDETLKLAASVTRPMGHLTLVGIGGGSVPFGFFSQPYEVSLATTYWGSLPELFEVIELAEGGHLRAQTQEFRLDDAPLAYEAMRAGTLHGRAVVVPS
jgi:propanol-preferring alcohol dehydrogenase